MSSQIIKDNLVEKLKNINKNLFLYAVLFPFVCIPTFNTDLQPLAGFLALFILISFSQNKFNSRQVMILSFILLFLYNCFKISSILISLFFSK